MSNRIKTALSGNQRALEDQWGVAQRQSNDYTAALKLTGNDIKKMESQKLAMSVNVAGRICMVLPKHACTPFSDGRSSFGPDTPGWEFVLQARIDGVDQFSTGGGTTYFTTLPDEIHEQVIKALANGDYELTEQRIWP